MYEIDQLSSKACVIGQKLLMCKCWQHSLLLLSEVESWELWWSHESHSVHSLGKSSESGAQTSLPWGTWDTQSSHCPLEWSKWAAWSQEQLQYLQGPCSKLLRILRQWHQSVKLRIGQGLTLLPRSHGHAAGGCDYGPTDTVTKGMGIRNTGPRERVRVL